MIVLRAIGNGINNNYLNMIKQTKSFQTSDNQLFSNRILALTHEMKIELRGVIQAHSNGRSAYTTTDIAAILANNAEQVSSILHKYRVSINRAKANVRD